MSRGYEAQGTCVVPSATCQYGCTTQSNRVLCTAESSKGMVQLRQCDLAKAEARDRPWQLISDLQCASATCIWPSIRVELNLEPDSERPDETRGTVVFKVGLSPCSMQQVLGLVVHASVDHKSVNGQGSALTGSCISAATYLQAVHVRTERPSTCSPMRLGFCA